MSLAIDIDKVASVLLLDHKWYPVIDKSFVLDAYEFLWYSSKDARKKEEADLVHGGGVSGICATGFSFKTFRKPIGDEILTCDEENYFFISGPLTSILAVRTEMERKKK